MRTGILSSYLFLALFFLGNHLYAQCDSMSTNLDPFDSTLVISAPPINIGYMVPSNFQTIDGFKLVEEAKLQLMYAGNDSIGSLFLTIGLAERHFQTISAGKDKVMILTDSSRIEGLLNVPDRGTFDSNSNMRVYQHICVLPLDLFYTLTIDPIAQIRVYYDGGYKHTIKLTPEQKTALLEALKCLGAEAGIFPKSP